MHTLTIRTRFTFGDHVRFSSAIQGCRGTGTINAITVDVEGQIDYIIEISVGAYSDLQPGILDDEISLLESDAEPGART